MIKLLNVESEIERLKQQVDNAFRADGLVQLTERNLKLGEVGPPFPSKLSIQY